jgi:hypothetical protein
MESLLRCYILDENITTMHSFENLNKEEALKAENEFLKMKMMLEKGAEFYSSDDAGILPSEVENAFLKNVMEFERQFDEQKLIKVFDKIGRPTHFKPASEIDDSTIDTAWENLAAHLANHGISLSACSPQVTKRELYRFTTEELFHFEMNDMNIPGMVHGYIYDEFHPDPVYETTRAAVEDCMQDIFRKEPLEWMSYYNDKDLRLNDRHPLTDEQFKTWINNFKKAYDGFIGTRISDVECVVDQKVSTVKGSYKTGAVIPGEVVPLKGNWTVQLEFDDELGYWYIFNVQIEGVKF